MFHLSLQTKHDVTAALGWQDSIYMLKCDICQSLSVAIDGIAGTNIRSHTDSVFLTHQ